jgi:hypothetical protein
MMLEILYNDICRAMLEKGIPKETVAEIAGLTLDALDQLLAR